MSDDIMCHTRTHAPGAANPVAKLREMLARIRTLAAVRRERIHLCRLEQRLLEDVGISRSDAEAEAARRLWDAPPHWRS